MGYAKEVQMGGTKDVLIKEGVKQLGKWGLGAFPGAGWAVTITSALHSMVNASLAEDLDGIRKLECCPHIELAGSFFSGHGAIGAMDRIHTSEGTVWEATNNKGWYYHPQQDFRMLHAVTIYRRSPDGRGWHVEQPGQPNQTLKHCEKCLVRYRG